MHSFLHSSSLARVRMATVAPRIVVHGDQPARALARALWSTAFDRVPPEERAWIERIEERRGVLADSSGVEIRANLTAGSAEGSEWATPFEDAIPLGGASMFMSIPALWGRFLLRVVRELAPRCALELGTAFGISTAFQAAALELNGEGTITTIDAAHDWGVVAERGFVELGLQARVDRRLGQIEDVLGEVLESAAGRLDFAFVDAEHQGPPTLRYFEQMLPHLSERAVVVFDDIAFNRHMYSAWRTIKRHPGVGIGVNIGRMGLVTLASRNH